MRLRTRIAALSALISALVVIGSGFVLLGVVESELQAEVDEVLQQRSRAFQPVLAELVSRDVSLAAGLGPVLGDSPARGTAVEGPAFDLGPAPSVGPPVGAGFDTITDEGRTWRRLTVMTSADGELLTAGPATGPTGFTVELFEPLDPTLDRIDGIRTRAWFVATGAIALSGALGYLAGRSSTRPLDRLVSQASTIGGDRPRRRVDAGGNSNEVRELEGTLNEMLDRIDLSMDDTARALRSSRAFAADAAHELRTPLAAISGNVEILRRHPDLGCDTRAEILGELAERGDWMERLLKSLRDLSRAELADLGRTEEIDLAELADEVVSGIDRGDQRDRVTLVAGGDHPMVCAPDGMRILIENLVRNALNHGRAEDGAAEIVVTVASGEVDEGPVEEGGSATGPVVRLTVEDSGPGIPEPDRVRVRRRFQRGATKSPGTGLGLALVEEQARLHGGRLEIGRSDLGGARFDVVLPARAR